MIRIAAALALCLLLAGGSRPVAAPGPVAFTEDEVDTILTHGPWPMEWSHDPTNRFSGKPEAIAFGRQLFFDTRLSANGQVSCATCHKPALSWTDGRTLGNAIGELDRNTPSIANVRLNRWFGWDGASDSLWAHSMRPFLDSREHGLSEREVAKILRENPDLSCGYRRAFGEDLPADEELALVNVGKALAAFQETVVTGRTPFDDFRDALAKRDADAMATYPVAAQRGLKIFAGEGRCSLCHFGPNFSHGEFHEIGIPVYRKSGGVDWGRYQGIKLLRASRFNRLGPYNDDTDPDSGMSTRHVDLNPQTFEQFKVPSLRNIAITAPYMHNGHFATLPQVVRHYSEIDPANLHVAHIYLGDEFALNEAPPTDDMLRPLNLTNAQIADVVAFLETLTETSPQPLPAAPDLDPCAVPVR
jgi:cytochrome c peroxidase